MDADGLALMLWVAAGGMLILLVALGIEVFLSSSMRARRRRAAAYRRYCRLIEKR